MIKKIEGKNEYENIEHYLCCVCGEEHGLDDIHSVEVKGKPKNICKECVDTVHGLI